MRCQRSILSLALLVCLNLVLSKFIPSNDSNIQYVGRFDRKNPSYVRMDWPGVEIFASFTGKSLSIFIEDEDTKGERNMYNVFLDGGLLVLNITAGVSEYQVGKDLHDGNHIVRITKRTEALFGISRFRGFVIDDNAALVPSPARPSRTIEFIGDSLTCGYGNEGKHPCPFSAFTENNWVAFGPLAARTLRADYHLEAWSGKGMVRNYGDKNPTSESPLPKYFGRTLANEETSVWNYQAWIPQAVVIYLGTNDFSTKPHPSADQYKEAYKRFVRNINNQYQHPQLFFVCAPVAESPFCDYVKQLVKESDSSKVHYVNFEHILSFPDDYGCNGHPNVVGHQKMANTITPIIKKVMQW